MVVFVVSSLQQMCGIFASFEIWEVRHHHHFRLIPLSPIWWPWLCLVLLFRRRDRDTRLRIVVRLALVMLLLLFPKVKLFFSLFIVAAEDWISHGDFEIWNSSSARASSACSDSSSARASFGCRTSFSQRKVWWPWSCSCCCPKVKLFFSLLFIVAADVWYFWSF